VRGKIKELRICVAGAQMLGDCGGGDLGVVGGVIRHHSVVLTLTAFSGTRRISRSRRSRRTRSCKSWLWALVAWYGLEGGARAPIWPIPVWQAKGRVIPIHLI
jgi:hypothetical protein